MIAGAPMSDQIALCDPLCPTIEPASHVAWLIPDDDVLTDNVGRLAREALDANERLLAFGPVGSGWVGEVVEVCDVIMDPAADVLSGGVLDPGAMFAAMRAQTEIAIAQGKRGIRIIADMRWLDGTNATDGEVIAFELALDRVCAELDATIICIYQDDLRTTRGADVCCVHPMVAAPETPSFQLYFSGDDTWRICGELDLFTIGALKPALGELARNRCILEMSQLRFADVASLREIAMHTAAGLKVTGAPAHVIRAWQAADLAPA